MPRLWILAGVAGVVVSIAAFAAWQSWRLEGALEAVGRAQAELEVCDGVNEANRRELVRLADELNRVVSARRLADEAAAQALVASRTERESIQHELAAARQRLEAIYEGDCSAWADVPVCPAVADELRQ